MAAPILAIANALLPGLFRAVDKVLPDKDAAQRMKNEIQMQLLDHDKKELESVTKIIVAESQSDSWLTRSWRPITALTFVGLTVCRWFGLTIDIPPEIEQEMWSVIKIMIGGYVVGRSAESVAKTMKKGPPPI